MLIFFVLLHLLRAVQSQQAGSYSQATLTRIADYLKNNSLVDILRLSSGYYASPTKAEAHGMQRTVLVTGGNFGYLNHIHNFNCFAQRLQLKYLVISMELHTHYYLQKRGFYSYYLDPSAAASSASNITEVIEEQSSAFREQQFNFITNRKKKAVLEILRLGYNVIFSDTDVVFRFDPLPYLIFKNMDYVHSLNMLCPTGKDWDFYRSKAEGNTGLYFVKSSNESMKIWYEEYVESFKQPGLDDQTIFWQMIRGIKDPKIVPIKGCRDVADSEYEASKSASGTHSVFYTCFLDECQFSAGMLRGYGGGNIVELQEQLRYRNNSGHLGTEMITVHANFMYGNRPKMEKLMQHNMWIATLGTPETDDYFMYFEIPTKPAHNPSDTHVGQDRRYWDGKCADYDSSGRIKDGTLVKCIRQAEVFIIKGGKKRSIPDGATFMAMGFDFGDVKTLSKEEFFTIEVGDPCPSNLSDPKACNK